MRNSAYFPAYFAAKSFAYFKKILRYKPASLTVVLEENAARWHRSCCLKYNQTELSSAKKHKGESDLLAADVIANYQVSAENKTHVTGVHVMLKQGLPQRGDGDKLSPI